MAKIVTAHQPAYLPWLGFFHKVALADEFVILDDVQFEKNSFINRNKIKTTNGPIWLTIPVRMVGHTRKTITEIEINNDVDWRSKHWKSIYFNYKKAPYFDTYSDFFEDFYRRDWTCLYDAIEHTLLFLLDLLGIKTVIRRQSELQINSRKQQLILDICDKVGSKIFVFGALGKDYADKEFFNKAAVKVVFQDYNHPSYPQLWGQFEPYLSVVDLMFNVEKQKLLDTIMHDNITREELKAEVLT